MSENSEHNIEIIDVDQSDLINKSKHLYSKKTFTLFSRTISIEAIITTFAIIFLSLLIFWDFIIQDKYYLFLDIGKDTINFFYAIYYEFSRLFELREIPQWNFSNGLGTNLFHLVFYTTFFSFSIFFGSENIKNLIVFSELFKIWVISFLFFQYSKFIKVNKYSMIIGTILFSFSAFVIIGGSWYLFSTEALLFIALLYSLERYLINQNGSFITITIALISAFQPFNLYLFGTFLLIYSVIRIISDLDFQLSSYSKIILKIGCYCIIGIGLTLPFSIPYLSAMLNSPRVGGESAYFNLLISQPIFSTISIDEVQTTVTRFFSNDLLGNGSNFAGYRNYLEAPMAYIGLFTLLLFPLSFNFFNRKQKIIFGLVLGFWLLSLTFPYFRFAFWLFTGDYYRVYSLFISFTLLYLSLKALSGILEHRKVNIYILIGSLIIYLILVLISYPTKLSPDNTLQIFITIFLIFYSILIYLLQFEKFRTFVLRAILLFVVGEVGFIGFNTVNNRIVLTSQEQKLNIGYNDWTKEAINYIKSNDKSFYRVEKEYSSSPVMGGSLNDAMVQNYYGTSSYNNFNQLSYINFLAGMKVIDRHNEEKTRWARGVIGRYLLQSLVGVKYNLTKSPFEYANDLNWKLIYRIKDVGVYRNYNAYPLGVAFEKYIKESEFNIIPSLAQSDFMALRALVVPDSLAGNFAFLTQLTANDTVTNLSPLNYFNITEQAKTDILTITHFDNNKIKGEIKLKSPKILFLSIPFDKGWHAFVDSKPVDINIVDFGLMGLKIDKGYHTIDLKYEIPYLNVGMIGSVISLLIFAGLIFVNKKKQNKIIS